ncbi:MAG: hypothetical protein GEU88_10170 [Solirubrobacterales bacterium]|nr:hypothetical protein [Solirubrobacterales bacterium]
MSRIRLLVLATVAALLFAHPTAALPQKPGGGQSVRQVGDNVADLISNNLGPLLIVLIGTVGIAAFMARSIGQVVMIVAGGLFAGVFIIEPSAAESLFKDIYDAIF